jgi:hypothetical protein
LSGDPPTGEGGHAGIVRALLRLRARSFGGGISSEDGENDGGGGRNRRSGTSDSNGSCSRQSDASSNATGLTSSPSSSSSCCGCSYAFDQVWILPVYRHPFQVRPRGQARAQWAGADAAGFRGCVLLPSPLLSRRRGRFLGSHAAVVCSLPWRL